MSALVRMVAAVALGSVAVALAIVAAMAVPQALDTLLAALPDAIGVLAVAAVAVAPLVWAVTQR